MKNTRIVEDARNEITVRIIDQKADYVLGLKGNQDSLHEVGPDYFVTDEAAEFKDMAYDCREEIDVL